MQNLKERVSCHQQRLKTAKGMSPEDLLYADSNARQENSKNTEEDSSWLIAISACLIMPQRMGLTQAWSVACRWQAERKANFPSESNLARKEEASKAIADSGGLDPNAQTRRLSLSQIVQKQREMGLSKAAGTEGFVFDSESHRFDILSICMVATGFLGL